MEGLINLIFFVSFLLGAFFIGSIVEKRHYNEIRQQEHDYVTLGVVSSKEIEYAKNIAACELISGNVVISLDYFKRFLAALRNIFGGRIVAYETLLDRGRREAILRMKKKARQKGYDLVLNMRFETSNIGSISNQKSNMACFEVLAYGTAVKLIR